MFHRCESCRQVINSEDKGGWCPRCGAVWGIGGSTKDQHDGRPDVNINRPSDSLLAGLPLRSIDDDSGRIWSHYPTLRVLKSVFWIAGILTGIGGSLILGQTGSWPVFISTTISAIVLMSVPEILLILVRIERSLASIDGKLKDK
ncbi:hypothetical protein N9Z08_00220 [Pirellulales bacterium]|nr:hypothetical protein [Pirellulales bacterium]